MPTKKHPEGVTPTSATAAARPDLSHIAEPLRPLAVPCSALMLDPANARRHPEQNLEAIKASLRVYGQRKPVVVNRRTGTIEAGNGTLEAARALGWSHLAAVHVDDDPTTAAGFGIADNRTAELAEWDREALDKLFGEIKTNDAVLDQMLADLSRSVDKASQRRAEPDEIPELPKEPITRPGDLIVLGKHRLVCGNAAKAEDVERLLGGAVIHLVHTDPQYNVKVEPPSSSAIAASSSSVEGTKHPDGPRLVGYPEKARPTAKKLRAPDRPLASDDLPEEALNRLLQQWFGNLARSLQPGGSFFVWGAHANLGSYPAILKACGLHFSQTIVWNKLHPVLTGKDFSNCFELAAARRKRAGPVRRRRLDLDRGRADGPPGVPDGDRSALLRCDSRALAESHRREGGTARGAVS
jgi:hypothetical protein